MDKLDPLFRESYDDAIAHEQLVLDLCFEQLLGEEVLRAIEIQVIDVQSAGPLAGPIEVPCWTARVRISPQSLPEISNIDSLYKVVLIEPAPEGSYLSKLDAITQFLARYRRNSAELAIFVHVEEELSQARVGELEELGLTLVPETWVPPINSHPTGFYLGQIQVFDIVRLAKRSDIIRITSAEEERTPSSGGAAPGVERGGIGNAN